MQSSSAVDLMSSSMPRRRSWLVAAFAVSAVIGSVGLVAAPAAADVADSDGSRVAAFGDVTHAGPDDDFAPNAEPIAIATAPTGLGYYVATTEGGLFTFDGAAFHGSAADLPLNAPVTDMAATEDGYWMAGADGAVLSFGSAEFLGSATDLDLITPVIGIAARPGGDGYWLAATGGGVFSFGTADFHGSAVGLDLDSHVVDIAATPTGDGYSLLTARGSVLSFGDATPSVDPALLGLDDFIGLEVTPEGGLVLVRESGMVLTFDAEHLGYRESYEPVTIDVAVGPAGGYYTLDARLPPPAPAYPTVDPNHPFLVCTRAIESDSSGGYRALNPSGKYRGAYQFSQATWNGTARHAERFDLVGVDPVAAAPADQDYLALHLYGWQGASPWLGRCAGR